MTTYIAEFKAVHKLIQVIQHSVFTWQQEGGEIDSDLLQGKIKRESSMHFYKLLAGDKIEVAMDDISVEITKTEPFNG
ncbi:GTP-binding protein LepA [uncultured Eudoraea sp.]|uniref:GTP-binding protein LepA n=1 Tax=uncultured Eudoraea sp. TaxID=1035614 RepID=UPI002619FC25|nr:GTP-binding protein LepA [uncultured Eudoraea sp.]